MEEGAAHSLGEEMALGSPGRRVKQGTMGFTSPHRASGQGSQEEKL